MTVSITSSPANPLIDKGAALSFSLSGGGNFVRLWCVNAPQASKLGQQIADALAVDPTASPRIEIFSGHVPADPTSKPFTFQPDTPGRYTITAQEYQRGASSWGGAYAGDPRGFDSETKRGTETGIDLDFGQRTRVQLGVAPDTATLLLYVFGDNVEATTFALHGVNSPSITEPKTPKARNAASLLQPVAQALAGQPATTLRGTVTTVIVGMINKMAGHFGLTAGSVHAAPDIYNVPNSAYALSAADEMVIKATGELITALKLHMTTDQARRTPFVSSGVGTGSWHNPGGGGVVADGNNVILSPLPRTKEDAYRALGDIWQAYEAHRVDTSVHGAVDSTYPMSALPPLMDLHREFIELVILSATTVAPNENPGVQVLVDGCGAKAD